MHTVLPLQVSQTETDSGRVSNDFSHDLIWFVKG